MGYFRIQMSKSAKNEFVVFPFICQWLASMKAELAEVSQNDALWGELRQCANIAYNNHTGEVT